MFAVSFVVLIELLFSMSALVQLADSQCNNDGSLGLKELRHVLQWYLPFFKVMSCFVLEANRLYSV